MTEYERIYREMRETAARLAERASEDCDEATAVHLRGVAHDIRCMPVPRIPPAPDDGVLVEETSFRRGQAATNADEMSWQPLRPSSQPSVKRGRAMSNDPAANMASLLALCDDLCETESATVDRRQLCEWLSAMQAQAHDIERLTQQCAALQSAINCRWTDRADDLSTEIDRTHPFKVKDFVRWNRAQVLVSNRHSKGALIALVAHLLHEVAERDTLRERIDAACEIAESLYQNPEGTLWNHGTTPSARDRAEWKGIKDTCCDMLVVLDPDRARIALGGQP